LAVTLTAKKVDGVFEFNLNNVLKAFLEFEFVNNTVGTYDVPKSLRPFYCVFTEYYDNSIGILSTGSTTTSSTYKANMINLDYYSSNLDSFILKDTTSNFLTNAPNYQYIGINEKAYLYFITNLEYVVLVIEKFVGNSNTATNYSGSITNGCGVFIVEVPASDVDKMEIWLEDSGEERISKVVTFKVRNPCKAYRLEWINNLGGLDCFNFTGNVTISSETQKTEIEKYLPNSHQPDFHKVGILQSSTQKMVNVFSGFVSELTANWLVELQASKSVWLNEEGTRKAITIKSSSITSKSSGTLVQLSLNFSFEAFDNY
jgi:hypothetical protein